MSCLGIKPGEVVFETLSIPVQCRFHFVSLHVDRSSHWGLRDDYG